MGIKCLMNYVHACANGQGDDVDSQKKGGQVSACSNELGIQKLNNDTPQGGGYLMLCQAKWYNFLVSSFNVSDQDARPSPVWALAFCLKHPRSGA